MVKLDKSMERRNDTLNGKLGPGVRLSLLI